MGHGHRRPRMADTVAAGEAVTAPLLTTRDLGDLSPSTAYGLASSGRLKPIEPAILAILKAVDANPGGTQPIGDVLRQAEMSYVEFRTALLEATGMTFQRYVIDARMRRARVLLASTDRSLQWIGSHVGYQTHEAFRAAFRVEHGMWPTEYRRQVRS